MFLYIDPGTGSMLFSILIGLLSSVFFLGRKFFLKIKFLILGGHAEKLNESKMPFVIFSDHKRYWNVFKPICDEFENRHVNLVYYTASPDDPALSQNYTHVKTEFIGSGNKAFARLNMLNAGILLSTTPGLDVYQWKKSRNVLWYVHIPHTVDDMLGYRMFGLDFYDAVLCTGDFQKKYLREIEEKRGINQKELKTVGCTYLDAMEKQVLEKTAILKNDSSKKKNLTVLLAPSWGKSAILSRYGKEIILALEKTGFKIIIRPHPQSLTSEKELIDSLQKDFSKSENIRWNFDNDNYEVLSTADVMITDFSGIIFDFSFIFNKPVIFADTNFDSSPYDAAWIDEELWRYKVLPNLGIPLSQNDFPMLKQKILELSESDEYRQKRDKVREETWQNRGNAAKATVDYLIQKSESFKNAGE